MTGPPSPEPSARPPVGKVRTGLLWTAILLPPIHVVVVISLIPSTLRKNGSLPTLWVLFFSTFVSIIIGRFLFRKYAASLPPTNRPRWPGILYVLLQLAIILTLIYTGCMVGITILLDGMHDYD